MLDQKFQDIKNESQKELQKIIDQTEKININNNNQYQQLKEEQQENEKFLQNLFENFNINLQEKQNEFQSIFESSENSNQQKVQQQQECINQTIEIIKDYQNHLNIHLKNQEQAFYDQIQQNQEHFSQTQKQFDEDQEMLESFYQIQQQNLQLFIDGQQLQKNQQNEEEMHNVLKDIERLEQTYIQVKKDNSNLREKKLQQIQQDEYNKYFDIKLQLEQEIQNHEKCLEDMKAVYQLNSEKLNYNYKILQEKQIENQKKIFDLKQKERHLMNQFKIKNDLFTKKNNQYIQQNNNTTQQIKKLTQEHKELHNKFKYFENSDLLKYQEFKYMKQQEIQSLQGQIKYNKKIIFEQQLGIAEQETDKENDIDLQVHQEKVQAVNQDKKNENSAQIILQFIQLINEQFDYLYDEKTLSEIEGVQDMSTKLELQLNFIRKVFNFKSDSMMSTFIKNSIESFDEDSQRVQQIIEHLQNNSNNEARRKTNTKLQPIQIRDMELQQKQVQINEEFKEDLEVYQQLLIYQEKYINELREREDLRKYYQSLIDEEKKLDQILNAKINV